MNQAPLARDLETLEQDNDVPPLLSRKRRMEWAHTLNFLSLSARYLGHALTARQLHSLVERIDQ